MPNCCVAAAPKRALSALCLIFSASLLVFLCSCSGQERAASALQPQPGRAESPAPLQLAGLPALDAVASRSASNSFGYVLGVQAQLLQHYMRTDDSDTLVFSPADTPQPGISGCAFAAFKIPVDDPGELRILPQWSTAPPAGACWLALGNRTSQRWDWQALSDPAAEIDIANFADYLGPDNSLLLLMLVPPGPSAKLDLLTVKTQTDAGWHFVELYKAEAADNVHYISPGAPFLLDGKPACWLTTYAYDSGFSDEHSYLAVSSSGTGDNIADWQLTPLDFSPAAITAIGSGLGALYTEYDQPSDTRTLYYGYAASPGDNFGKEVLASDKSIVGAMLSSVGGRPAVVFSHTDQASVTEYAPSFASSDAVSGGTWSSGLVGSTAEVSTALSALYTTALDYSGKAEIGFYDIGVNPAKFTVAVAKGAHPAGPSDWDLTQLGDGYDGGLWGFIRHGKPCFIALQYVVFSPDQIKFWSYELGGSDPAQAGDWSTTFFDSLGLGNEKPASFAAVNDKLSFLRITSDSSTNFLDGDLSQLSLWSADAPGNSAASWNQEQIQTNDELFYPQLLDLNGQPAFVQVLRYQPGYGADDRTGMRMVWAVYEP